MKPTPLTTTTLLLSLLMSSFSFAGDKSQSFIEWADVITVKPITRMVERTIPERKCWHEDVLYEKHYDDGRSFTGTILGGIIGGAVGNAVGHKKKNKQIGTAVGAILGASIGHDIAGRNRPSRHPRNHIRTEERCEITEHVTYEEETVGYKVWYRYNGEKYKTRMDRKPGNQIRVRVNVQPL